MKIEIIVSPEEYLKVKILLENSIINYDKWISKKEKLKYKLGNLVCDDIVIITDNIIRNEPSAT